MSKLHLSILIAVFLVVVFSFVFLPNYILAANPGPGPPSYDLPDPLGGKTIPQLILDITNWIITNIAIPLAVLMVIIAGLMFVTAGGSEEKVTKAKRNLVWTLIGVAIVVASKMVITYITDLLGGGGGSLGTLVGNLKNTLNLIIGVLFALALVFFCWGVVQYVVGASGDEEKLKEGKRHMVWGIIGMAIMASAVVIINMIKAYIG